MDDSITRIFPGQSFHVAPHQVHRFGAVESAVQLVEVSTPHLGDVIRLEDDYSRSEDDSINDAQSENEELEELYRIYGGD